VTASISLRRSIRSHMQEMRESQRGMEERATATAQPDRHVHEPHRSVRAVVQNDGEPFEVEVLFCRCGELVGERRASGRAYTAQG
jgi:hypothetical protein